LEDKFYVLHIDFTGSSHVTADEQFVNANSPPDSVTP